MGTNETHYGRTLAKLDVRGERSTEELGMGPVTINVASARAIGWSDETIATVAHAMYLAVRGANMTQDMADGRVCEFCGGANARHDCGACTRKGVAPRRAEQPAPRYDEVYADGVAWLDGEAVSNPTDPSVDSERGGP